MLIPEDKGLDIFVASRIGSFKHIKYFKDPARNSKKCVENLLEVKSLQKDDTITAMVWGNAEQTEILVGRKNQQVQVYDTQQGFTKLYAADFAPGHVVGLGRHGRRITAALSSGAVRTWGKEEITMEVGKVDRMRVFGDGVFATGGEENDLKVWRLGEKLPTFSAKNLPHDWLQLRQPVWVTDLCFLQETLLAACSRHGYVRLYDTRAQRRPVTNVETKGMAATCISPSFDERQVLVGFGRGQLHQVDLRQGRLDKGYKGSVGAVTDIALTNDRGVVSASLDRHLRVHRYDTKELVYKQYLTSKLTCVLVQTEGSTPLRNPPVLEVKEEEEEVPQLLEDLDDIFEGMETVGDKPRKKPAEVTNQEAKRQKLTTTDTSIKEEDDEEAIRKLLRSTEKQKRRQEKKKREKKAKSVFHNA